MSDQGRPLDLPLLAPALPAGPPDKATAAELKRLEGTWRAVKVQVGKKSAEPGGSPLTLSFKGGRWTLTTPDGTGEGAVKLDLSKKPHRLDLVGKGVTLFCVYSLDKGRLRLCWWGSAKDRQGTLDPLRQKPPGPVLDARRSVNTKGRGTSPPPSDHRY